MPTRYDYLKQNMVFRLGGAGSSATPASSGRTLQSVTPTEGGTVQILDDSNDGMTLLSPAAAMQSVTLALPQAGANMQQHVIASMNDIANIVFTGGTVLNAPAELVTNQAVTIERIDLTNKIWITV